ncbi:MAG TPA: hypothetical protein VMW06_03335 [Desulfobacterales bacterium]|nr:hypothetical protein [Desulfobacterales bacterium]
MNKKRFTIIGLAISILLIAALAFAFSTRQENVWTALQYFEQGLKITGGPFECTADQIKQSWFNRRFTLEEFENNPVTAGIEGGAATGVAGDENVMAFEDNIFEYHILGAGQTKLAPILAAGGLDIALDLGADEGLEISQGITARSRSAFVIGTDAFYFKATFYITDITGTDDCAVGFRTAEAYQANIDDYNNMAVLNVIAGAITIETIDDDAATVPTDTTDTWADLASHTLAVYVDVNGVVTYTIDGSAPTTTAAFTWDDGDTVVPFFYFLHTGDFAEATYLTSWECGLQ